MEAIRAAGLSLAVDPLGGAGVAYWEPINRRYGLDIAVVNKAVDPTFRFMTVDHDGRIRMDCSSPYAMAGLVGQRDRYRVAFANDPDADRHGIVVPSAGLLNPNHYLAVAIRYLLTHRPQWPRDAAIGKTLVSSGDDRSRRRVARPPALRGARRVQVVRVRAPRRLVLLRRRGVRRRELPRARRQRMDHRQGRTHHEPARGRDHRASPDAIPASTIASSPASSARPCTPGSMRPPRRSRRRGSRNCRPLRSPRRSWPASPSRPGSRARRATTPRSAGSR